MITVFTPTYNRAYRLSNLYNSLLNQSRHDFEWVIVDDGSTDNTEELVAPWLNNTFFNIVYFKQNNSGKYKAINKGVTLSSGDLFYIVDSDDILPSTAIEVISNVYDDIKEDHTFGGICGLKCYYNGEKVGGGENFGILDCSSLDFRYRFKMQGDMAEVIKTDVMKEFPFPDFGDEKFCPEALLFNRISQKYKLRYFYRNVYHCEYLPDGLTASIVKIRMNSPHASTLYYNELFHYRVPLLIKIRSIINYWRFAYCMSEHDRKLLNGLGLADVFKFIGYFIHKIDMYRYIE